MKKSIALFMSFIFFIGVFQAPLSVQGEENDVKNEIHEKNQELTLEENEALKSEGDIELEKRLEDEPASILLNDINDEAYIYSVTDLKAIKNKLEERDEDGKPLEHTYKLMTDLDLSGEVWSAIGTTENPFVGRFDGNGYSISNLTLNPDDQYSGLFGVIDNAVIENIHIKHVNITKATPYIGGIVGLATNSYIKDSSVEGGQIESTSGASYTGGIVGRASDTTLERTMTHLIIKGNSVTGAMVGSGYESVIIRDSYSLSTVVGNQGAFGYMGSGGKIENSYFAGKISSGAIGLGGGNNKNNYYNIDIQRKSTNATDVATGRTTEDMMKQETFLGWDFENVWSFGDDAYPMPYLKHVPNNWITEVSSVTDLEEIKENPVGNYKLMIDLDLSGEVWSAIGTTEDPFVGHFDGNGHSISNLTLNPDNIYSGLFGVIDNSVIENIHIKHVNITKTTPYIGGIVGLATDSYIKDSSVLGGQIESTSSASYTGGIVGRASDTILERNMTQLIIKGNSVTGAMVGSGYASVVIRDSYSLSTVVGNQGAFGYMGSGGKIENSYFAGKISSGAVGLGGGVNKNNYYDTDMQGKSTNASDLKIGRTTEEMMKQETFLGWDFENVWMIDEGKDYPMFAFERNEIIVLTASEYEFLSEDAEYSVYFYAEVQLDTDFVGLYNNDNNLILELKDDGLFSKSGDDLLNDNIYSGKLPLDLSQAQELTFYAKSSNGGKSNDIGIVIIKPLSNKDVENMAFVDQAISTVIRGDQFKNGNLQVRYQLVEKLLNELSEQGKVHKSSIFYDDHNSMFSFSHDCGVGGNIMLQSFSNDKNNFSSENNFLEDDTFSYEEKNVTFDNNDESNIDELVTDFIESTSYKNSNLFERKILVFNWLEDLSSTGLIQSDSISFNEEFLFFAFYSNDDTLYRITIEEVTSFSGLNPGIEEVLSPNASTFASNSPRIGKALILNSFENEPFRREFYEDLKDEWGEKGLETTVDTYVTIGDFKSLKDSDYNAIILSGHGVFVTYTYGPTGQYSNSTPFFVTNEGVTASRDVLYDADLQLNKIRRIYNSDFDNDVYMLQPSFVTSSYGSNGLDGKFIFSESCTFYGENNTENNRFAQSFLGCGAEAVVGYHNSVLAVYSRELMKTYFDKLIDGSTVQESFDEALNIHGEDDGFGAYPLLRGDSDATLLNLNIKNGSFEEYLVYWDKIGDVRSIQKLGELTVPKGNIMAFISTGIGSKEQSYIDGKEGSVLSQRVKVPYWKNNLTFTYNVVSEEPMEFVGSRYDDKFILVIEDEHGNELESQILESVNISTWYPVTGINFEGGDDTVYQTNWIDASIDLSSYKNEIITIKFVVIDVGDSAYDTGVLLDDIELKLF